MRISPRSLLAGVEILSLADTTQSRLARIILQADRSIARLDASERLARRMTKRYQFP